MGKRATEKMKKCRVMGLVFLVVFLTANILHAGQQTVLLQANESPPIWSETLPLGGMGTEIVQAISKEMGIKTCIEFVPLKRMIADTTNNDLGNPIFYMNNQDFAAIIPIAVSYNSFFTYHKDTKKLSSIREPKEKRIGILTGSNANPKLLSHFGKFEESYSTNSLFKKLNAQRIDIVVALDLVGLETIRTLFPNHIDLFSIQVIPASASPIAIMIDSKYPDANTLALHYQEGLRRIIKNGTYRKILEKYYNKTTIPANWHSDLSQFEKIYSTSLEGDGL